MRGVTGGVGNGSEDFGAGGLTFMGGPQLVGKRTFSASRSTVTSPETALMNKSISRGARERRAQYVDCCRAATTCPRIKGDYFIPSASGPAQCWPNSGKTARVSGPWPRDLRLLGG